MDQRDAHSRHHHVRRNSKILSALEELRKRRQENIMELITKPPKIESPVERFDLLSHNCLSFFADTTSIHGPKWYNLMPNYFCRFLLAAFIIIFLVIFPLYFYKEMYAIYTSNSVSTSIEWQRESGMKYPNLTVCFAKFFDKKRLNDEGISNNLANYMTMAIDPSSGHIVKFMEKEIPTYRKTLADLQVELQNKLNSSGISLPELFHKVAIRCDDFISLCEVHREIYLSSDTNLEEKCCGTIFNPVPFFSNVGTCFTTHSEIIETLPFTFSSIKVWLNMQSDNSPEFELIFKGSDALERRDAFYTISDQDHPITKLMQYPRKVPRGTSVLLGLNIYKIDRSGLRNGFCRSNVEIFEEQFKVSYTKLNCEFFANSGFQHDCSLSPYHGVVRENSERPCVPADFLNVSSYFDNNIFNNVVGGENTVCLPLCLRTEYQLKITEGLIDTETVTRFSNMSHVKQFTTGNPKDLVIIQMHFNSFDFEYHSLSQPTFVDLLSKLGGWLGVVVGASICSFAEMIVYVICFLYKLRRKKVDWP